MVSSNYATTAFTTSDFQNKKNLLGEDCLSTRTETNHTNDLPATRKRRSQQRSDFVQVDNFVATKKAKTEKKDIEEEFATTWICVECKEAECIMEPNATELLICDGVCRRVFHYPCAGLSELPPDDIPFICNDCINQKHVCSLCSNYGYDNEDVYKCSKSNCGLFYHESCLSMRNIEVTMIIKKTNSGTDEALHHINIKQEVVVNDDSDVDHDDFDLRKKASTATTELRFVCPAHSCWTCTQTDLKDELQQQNIVVEDTTTLTKKTKKKKKGSSSAFEAKREPFLTVRHRNCRKI